MARNKFGVSFEGLDKMNRRRSGFASDFYINNSRKRLSFKKAVEIVKPGDEVYIELSPLHYADEGWYYENYNFIITKEGVTLV